MNSDSSTRKQDVNALKVLEPGDAQKFKATIEKIAQWAPPSVPGVAAAAGTKPGVERWDIKTGNDKDVTQVGMNQVAAAPNPVIVPARVEELINMARPPEPENPLPADPKGQFSQYWYEHRVKPVEITIWRVQVDITAIKRESDGDYHLVLQGDSGETMIGEVPEPDPEYIKNSPWADNIKAARNVCDTDLFGQVKVQGFVQGPGKYLIPASAAPSLPADSVKFQPDATQPFESKIRKTATITGVGFFDVVHGQMGVSQSNGIELHPILDIKVQG